ncbi:hypothetical protein KCP70_00505 [Salmonella enterica subsp. enterica]|nr:hypothetical protein KCP70_00505 [Salmonella enterica subsp. enterica]
MPKRIHQFRRLRCRSMPKQKEGVAVCRHCGSFCNRGGEKVRFCAILSPDKTHHWMAGRHDRMYRNFGFFAARRGRHSLWGWALYRTTIRDSRGLRRARVTRD